MSFKERRKFHRVDTYNLHLDISVKGIEDSISSSIRCRIVNLSMDGLKLETPFPIELQDVHLKTSDSENNPNEIKGKIVYCEEISQDKFHVGIGLTGSNIEKFKFISKLTNQFGSYHVNFKTMADNVESTI
jgi:hypothetical protein